MRVSLVFLCFCACTALKPAELPDERDCAERSVLYQDTDGDGFGADDHIKLACKVSSGWSETGGDCDDSDADVTVECHDFDTGEPVDTGDPEDTGSQDTGDSGVTEPESQ